MLSGTGNYLFLTQIKRKNIWLYFDSRDVWIGWYNRRPEYAGHSTGDSRDTLYIREVFVQLLPMIGFKFQWVEEVKAAHEE